MIVKDSHPLLRRKLAAFFAGTCLFEAKTHRATTQEAGRGRIERREIHTNADMPAGYIGFPGVNQLCCLKRMGELRAETVYGLTSLRPEQAGPKRLLDLLRGHWYIENRSPWVRDVTFDEDRSQVRTGSIPQVMAALRNLCIGLLRANGHTNIAVACRYHVARPEAALAILGIGKTE